MQLSRRQAIGTGLAMAATFFGLPALANTEEFAAAIEAFTGGADTAEGGITLIVPEIAENGNNVPVEVDAPGAEAIMVFANANPNPEVATFNFGPLSGSQLASTRVRLAGTQDVIAIARMPGGEFIQTSANVRVTIGGCGG